MEELLQRKTREEKKLCYEEEKKKSYEKERSEMKWKEPSSQVIKPSCSVIFRPCGLSAWLVGLQKAVETDHSWKKKKKNREGQ